MRDTGDGTPAHRYDILRDARIRMNDGGCDPDGRFYCGGMHEAAAGSLFGPADDGG